jgi:hypothetical protein
MRFAMSPMAMFESWRRPLPITCEAFFVDSSSPADADRLAWRHAVVCVGLLLERVFVRAYFLSASSHAADI